MTGNGVQRYSRTCPDQTCVGDKADKAESCTHCPIFSSWETGACMCNAESEAFEVSTRTCIYLDTGLSAADQPACVATDLTKTESCDNSDCPIWGSWGEWSECSVLCYNADQPVDERPEGHTVRTRNCTNGSYNDPSGACPFEEAIQDELCEDHTGQPIPTCDEHLAEEFEGQTIIKFYIDFKVRFHL